MLIKRLEDAVKSGKYDLTYLFVLNEFGQYLENNSRLLDKVQPKAENVILNIFHL